MASLKEIKGRIASVNNTLKITSAMKMVASAKLHRTQSMAASFAIYCQSLESIASSLGDEETKNKWSESDGGYKCAIVVAISSDSSLCGSFNNNIIKSTHQKLEKLKAQGFERIVVYPIGEKMVQAISKSQYEMDGSWAELISQPDFNSSAKLANHLMEQFATGRANAIYLCHNHLFSMGKQSPIDVDYLPMTIERKNGQDKSCDYIFEPSKVKIEQELLPFLLRSKLYGAILDSAVSEHAARMIAMQTATDNATDLLDELKLLYNKSRQQAITAELLDIRTE